MFDFLNFKSNSNISNKIKAEDDLLHKSEVFSLEHLQIYAEELAENHGVTESGKIGFDLLGRLEENKNELVRAYKSLIKAEKNEPISPAAEWLIDNFHTIDEQLREVKQDLPPKFYRELPKLEKGEFKDFPRIYHLASEIVAHTDNRLEAATLKSFIDSYQKISTLSIGEIWAFPISLRLALIENLSSFGTKILQSRQDRLAADDLADELAKFTDKEFSGKTNEILSKHFDEGRLTDKFSQSFLVQLAARLHEGDYYVGYALEKLERRLRPEGVTLEHLAHREHGRQASAQVSVSNIITSMRLLSTLDWRDFFESVSLVDRVLCKDPAEAYSGMDFVTRDSYRRQIERIAKRTPKSEIEVAEMAIELSNNQSEDKRKKHIGYYLNTDKGLAELENHFGYSTTFQEHVVRFLHKRPAFFYFTKFTALTIIFLFAFVYFALPISNFSLLALIFVVFLAIIPASELAITFLNRYINAILSPRLLPKMELKNGIPSSARTIVVVPMLLTDESTIKELCGNLEVYYLANRDKELYFALLGDLNDSDQEATQLDAELCSFARRNVAEINQKYSKDGLFPRFMFYTRKREWNAGEEKWICAERKRGNLHEFNRLLRGNENTSFDEFEPINFKFLKTIRYVLTLDADTQLPRDTAKKLIGTIEHPLNRPVFDSAVGRVTEGYAILQPRIEISLPSALKSSFSKIFSAGKGFDPYTTAVSDVYQDLFGEGSYVGKGLYDVDAFEAALDRRIPQNKLLSHDLFEGLYARVALLTDVALYDDYPSGYVAFAKRNHRWVRGDWQIARWLLPFVPDSDGRTVRNSLPMVARWKIFDNLRRSLVAPTLVLLLVFGWIFLAISPFVVTVFALIVLTAPLYLHVVSVSISPSETGKWTNLSIHISNLWKDIKTIFSQMFFRFVFMVHEAVVNCDAILRTFYRKFVSKKHLLEWVTAAT
jgi:cyclic beta-1,2-glucan synthetase